MITAGYCREMARYNQWQNNNIRDVVKAMPSDDLMLDRGAFFGSILGTLNHLLWGDMLWISRFDGGASPQVASKDSPQMTKNATQWAAERFHLDGRIIEWARKVRTVDLVGDLEWYSGVMGCDMRKPMAICVMQLFNHQTHHRGQAHALLTAAGHDPGATDIPFMP